MGTGWGAGWHGFGAIGGGMTGSEAVQPVLARVMGIGGNLGIGVDGIVSSQ